MINPVYGVPQAACSVCEASADQRGRRVTYVFLGCIVRVPVGEVPAAALKHTPDFCLSVNVGLPDQKKS